MKNLFPSLSLLLFPLLLNCQAIEIGPSLGLSLYYGDLTPDGFNSVIQNTNMAGGAFARLIFPGRLSVQLSGIYTQVSGDDANNSISNDRMLNFKSDIAELVLLGEWNIVRLGSSRHGAISPYIYAGFGGFYFNPKAKIDGAFVDLHPIGTEGQGLDGYPSQYSRVQPVIPIGAGFKIEIQDFGTITLDLGARKLFTDYLDDVSGTFVTYQDILSQRGPRAARLSNPALDPKDPDNINVGYSRGGSEFNDWYYIMKVSIGVLIGKIQKGKLKATGIGCPRF